MRKYTIKNRAGERYGRLVIIALAERASETKARTSMWICRCDCGNTTTTQFAPLKMGRTKSCGCYNRELTRSRFRIQTLQKQALRYLKEGAKERNLVVTVSDEFLLDLMEKTCYYCDAPPSNCVRYGVRTWMYNGIDRADNTKGYTFENCVPCCQKCNRAKSVMSQSEFIDLIKRIYEKHVVSQGLIND